MKACEIPILSGNYYAFYVRRTVIRNILNFSEDAGEYEPENKKARRKGERTAG